MAVRDTESPPSPALPRKQHSQEHPQQNAQKVSVGRQAEAHGIGEGEHPLPVARFGEEAVNQPRGGVGGSSGQTAWAQFALALNATSLSYPHSAHRKRANP
jgi:hypothetical protein